MRTRIKLCGLTRLDDIRLADELKVDAIGLVFYAPSPRAVSLSQAQQLAAASGPFCSRVALFVNPTIAEVQEVLQKVSIDVLQFHGDESPEFCQQFNKPWIKALRVKSAKQLQQELDRFSEAKGWLLDAFKAGTPGGTGEVFDWQLIPKEWRSRIILAGGLTPANVATAITQLQPLGVDVSGGIESASGIKSPEKMMEFVRQVNRANNLRH